MMVTEDVRPSVLVDAMEVLERMRVLLTPRDRWLKGKGAERQDGTRCQPHERDAYAFCIRGAFMQAARGFLYDIDDIGKFVVTDNKHTTEVEDVIEHTIRQVTGYTSFLDFNDNPATTYEDVVTAIDRCLDVLADDEIAKSLSHV